METKLDLESKDCYSGMVELSVTILLAITLPMLFVGPLDTANIQAGPMETSGLFKTLTLLRWMM